MIEESLLPLDDGRQGARAWSPATVPARLAEIGVAGALVGVLMVLLWLHPRTDLAQAPAQLLFWLKAAYTGGLALAALGLSVALVRGVSQRPVWLAGAGLVLAMLVAAGVQAAGLEPAALVRLLGPADGAVCLGIVLVVAAPMLAFATLGLKGLDLERPVALGLAAGLFSGGVAASVYGLHCQHASYVFVGLWYTAAVGLCGAAGAGAMWLIARRGPLRPDEA